jgi:hypothetical protein
MLNPFKGGLKKILRHIRQRQSIPLLLVAWQNHSREILTEEITKCGNAATI